MRRNLQRSQNYTYNLRKNRNKRFDINRDQGIESTSPQTKQKTKSYRPKRDHSVIPPTSEPLYTMANQESQTPLGAGGGNPVNNTSADFHGFSENIHDFSNEGPQPTREQAATINARLDDYLNQNGNPIRGRLQLASASQTETT